MANTLAKQNKDSRPLLLVLGCVCLAATTGAAAKSEKVPLTSKWDRFEQSFRSTTLYAHPLEEGTLTVEFRGPSGETHRVFGFWDGDRTWRVRFSPDQVGRWTFRTVSSDVANKGLHNQTGEFLCTTGTGPTRFNQHGPVRVAADHRHFEHADGTPFFWVADTVWNGPRISEPKNWEFYAQTRASQHFTVAQWAVAPGHDIKGESALIGGPDQVSVNPGFFRRLENKMEVLSKAGILSAIVPLLELDANKETGNALSDDQAVLFLRYVIARWSADPVAWVIAFEEGTQAKKVSRWKRIGQEVLAPGRHAPVILYSGQTPQVLESFRDQPWVDAFGCCNVGAGPFAKEWTKEPSRPLIIFSPHENDVDPESKRRFTADDVRREFFWGLLQAPPAGVSYGAQGVVEWDTSIKGETRAERAEDLPMCQKALFMPGAKQLGHVANFMNSFEFWRVRPEPQFLAASGNVASQQYIVAAGSDAKTLVLAYVPEDRTVEIFCDALPSAPTITWLNPRTGETNPAVAVVGARVCQFPTPDPGDWLLVMKAGK